MRVPSRSNSMVVMRPGRGINASGLSENTRDCTPDYNAPAGSAATGKPFAREVRLDSVNIAGIALGLAMDAFAVAIASSITLGSVSVRQIFRLAFHFGLFQAMMPVLGWLAGRSVAEVVGKWDHWAAFALLAFIGMRAIRAALSQEEEETVPDPTRGLSLVMLSVATSIDALAVGLSFAMLHIRIWYPALVIGVVAATMTTLGMLLGTRLGSKFGRNTEIAGGLILILIGLNILVRHLRE